MNRMPAGHSMARAVPVVARRTVRELCRRGRGRAEFACTSRQEWDDIDEGTHPVDGPKVSVLVPIWNFRDYLEDCVGSILSQTYSKLEVVLVDDGSTDGSAALAASLIEGDERACLWRNPVNLGAFRNSLRCLELSDGELVKFVHGDDILRPEAISRMVGLMGASPDVVLVAAGYDRIGPGGDALPGVGARLVDPGPVGAEASARAMVMDGLSLGNAMLSRTSNALGSPSAVLFRRSELERWPGALEPRPRWPNFDLRWWLRVMVDGRVAYIPEALSVTRVHPGATSSSIPAFLGLASNWSDVLAEARALGYLKNRDSEIAAVASQLAMMLGRLRYSRAWRAGRTELLNYLRATGTVASELVALERQRAGADRGAA